jgi:hypothetical protein
MMFDRIAKAVVGSAVAFVAALVPALSDGVVTSAELSVLIAAVLGGFAFVWAVPKVLLGGKAKAVFGAVAAGGAAFLTVYADGSIAGDEWYYLLSAILGGVFVHEQPNEE